MSMGLGTVQRAVLEVVEADPAGVATDTITGQLYGPDPRPAQREPVRRALRTLRQRGLIDVSTQPVTRTRRSLERIFDLSGCDPHFARSDPGWLQDLAVAEASGYVHHTASAERLVSVEPRAVDHHRRRLQHAAPAAGRAGRVG
jgi:hypothetical protein